MKTKDRVNKNQVNICIIKDGKLIEKKSNIENGSISVDELRLLKMTSNEENINNIENVYKCLSDNGYTVIRLLSKTCQIFVGYTMKNKDKGLILDIIEDEAINKKIEIYNRVKSSYGREYEIINTDDEITAEIILEIVIKEKLNDSFEREKKILNEYRNFDVKKLMLKANTKEVINNSNSGVIVITTKRIITSTLRKNDLKAQINSILENVYYGKDIKELNVITIEILKNKNIIINKPEKINEFQLEMLKNFIKLFNSIKVENLIVNSKSIKTQEFIKYLTNNEVADKNIKIVKEVPSVKSRKIGNIELKSILKIKDYDKNDKIGLKVKNEIEQYALKGLVLKGNAENRIIGNKIKNSEAYSIIQKMGDKYIDKIPQEIMKNLKKGNTKFYYNARKKFESQNIQKETIELLSYINLNYWCNKQEKEELEWIYKRNEEKVKFNNEQDLEKLKDKKIDFSSKNAIAIVKKEGIIAKIFGKIRKALGIKRQAYNN